MKLKEVDVSSIKLFLDGKHTGYVQRLTVTIDSADTSCVRAEIIQKVPESGGVFGSSLSEKVTKCFLRSWKGNVIRLRSEGVEPAAIEEPEVEDEANS